MKQPEVFPENINLWLAVEYFGAYLFDGMGGLSASGAALAIDHLTIEPSEKSGLLKRLASFLTTFNKAKNEQQDNHRAAK